jgi:cell division protein FtsB
MPSDEQNPRRPSRVGTEHLARRGHGTAFYVLVFVTAVLVLNAIFGDKGVMATSRARREHDQLAAEVTRAKAENARLRETERKLQADPATIEALAREELGLIRPGEKIFIIRDLPPTPPTPPRRQP